ncbi:cutinase family protein [Corynebacterium aquilae]|uniref:Carbohydrate esterase n=1 Tax=Corynebacterium aquilae DSM 44791 TaxID=1431546 RepID=A0A1L7CIM2_9CORY|nr:cutinase family protein [Corynebacterium aquilae]APT85623.1 carbohydrate esterase [Corynebacterium aquilae DSM 44791]
MKKALTVIAAIIVVALIIGGIAHYVSTRDDQQLPPGAEPAPTEAPPTPEQPDWCPTYEVIAAPGTWESAADDDPINPQANPNSFMLTVTRPLQERYTPDEVKVWTLPYTAQFKSRQAMDQMGYDESRDEGTSRVRGEMITTHEQCPKTEFILTGFSQGAVIIGDLANDIGNSDQPIPADRVKGVALVADGRREPGVGIDPGYNVPGVGAEVSLEALNPVVGLALPGATMRGPRVGGFGSLSDRTFEICAPNDHICDLPIGVPNAIDRAQAIADNTGIHAQYATNPDVIPGQTTSQWLVGWVEGLIDN